MTDGISKIKEIVTSKPLEKVENLAHLINKEALIKSHKAMEKDKAPGVDGMNKEEYEGRLEERIENLVGRMKSGAYRPRPVLRTYIPKDGSDKMRPLGLPSYEDKLVQKVMAEILTVIYEPIFMDFSYGFRPEKSCHMAISELMKAINDRPVNYILDADIKSFFDNVNHDNLIFMLKLRIADRRFIELVEKFLKAGIMEDGKKYKSEVGTPQGGNISTILANIYLHYTLDLWFGKAVKSQIKGRAYLVRYADDFVLCFEYEEDAQKVYRALPGRLGKAHLSLAEEKTKIIEFGRNAKQNREKIGKGKPETFDFLGFTFYCSKSRNGSYRTKVKSSRKKLNVKNKKIKGFITENMHMKFNLLIKKVNTKLLGHYRYYGVTDNSKSIAEFYWNVGGYLFNALNRRSNRKSYTWEGFGELLKYAPLLRPKIYVNLLH